MATLHLIRHGQASFGTDHYDCLSTLGERQSGLLGQHYRTAGITFTAVVCGGMQRHRQTFDACLAAMDQVTTPHIDTDFNEFDHEEIVARFRPEFADKAAMRAWLAKQDRPARAFQQVFDSAMTRWLSGDHDDYSERWDSFRQRCLRGLRSLLAHSGDGTHVAVFTSGGPISIIAQHLLGVPDSHALKLNYAMINASVTRLFHRGQEINLSSFNSYTHLESANDPTLITYR